MRIIFIGILCWAQSAWAQQFHLSGTIKGMADESLRLMLPADHFGRTWSEDIQVVRGEFSKTVTIPASGWMKMSYRGKDRMLYVSLLADSLKLDFEADFLDDDQGLALAGNGAELHRFQAKLNERFGQKLSAEWLTEQAKDATNIDAMEMETFRLRNEAVSMLEKHEPKLPSDFIKAYKNHLGYYYYLSLFKFSELKTAKSSIPKATEIPKVLIEGLTWERMNRDSELDSRFFRDLLIQYVDYKALQSYDYMKFADRHSMVQEGFNQARENLSSDVLRFYLTQTMLSYSEHVQPSLLRLMRDHLKGLDGASVHLKLVEDSLRNRLIAKDDVLVVSIPDATPAKDEVDVELQGLNGKNFRLSELKGKVVYLDIWASWCGPCRKEFPSSKALKDKLSNKEKKNIEFLYISIDNTETVWKLAIEELGIEGVHGLSKGGWGSEVTAKFGVHSIPRYIIFDKKGKVVDGNAPRPSDPRLLEILQKLAAQ